MSRDASEHQELEEARHGFSPKASRKTVATCGSPDVSPSDTDYGLRVSRTLQTNEETPSSSHQSILFLCRYLPGFNL